MFSHSHFEYTNALWPKYCLNSLQFDLASESDQSFNLHSLLTATFFVLRIRGLLGSTLVLKPVVIMLLNSFLSALVVAYSAVQVTAHAAIAPALGVPGTPARNNVERPSANKPCGSQALSAIDTSKAVVADASGAFQVSITNFNGCVVSPVSTYNIEYY